MINLPPELVDHIFSFLSPLSLLRATEVCKTWNALAKREIHWRGHCIKEGIPESMGGNIDWKSRYLSFSDFGIVRRSCSVTEPHFPVGVSAIYANQSMLFIGDCNGCILISDLTNNTLLFAQHIHSRKVISLVASEEHIYSLQEGGILKVWDQNLTYIMLYCMRGVHSLARDKEFLYFLYSPEKELILYSALCFDDRGHKITGYQSGFIFVSPSPLPPWQAHYGDVTALKAYHRLLFSGGRDSIKIWDIESRENLRVFQTSGMVVCLEFYKDILFSIEGRRYRKLFKRDFSPSLAVGSKSVNAALQRLCQTATRNGIAERPFG